MPGADTTRPDAKAREALAATTLTDVLTITGRQPLKLRTIVVCNRGGSSATFRIAISPQGESIDDAHYLYYDKSIAANDTALLEFAGIPLGLADVVRAYASNGNLSVAVFTE